MDTRFWNNGIRDARCKYSFRSRVRGRSRDGLAVGFSPKIFMDTVLVRSIRLVLYERGATLYDAHGVRNDYRSSTTYLAVWLSKS